MEMDKLNLGEYIKQVRLQSCLTQEELANILFITPQAVSKWERNESLPDINMIKKLSKVFNISVDKLISSGNDGIDNLTFDELKDLEGHYTILLNNIYDKKEKKRVIHNEKEFAEINNFDFDKNTRVINEYKVLFYDFETFFNDYDNRDILYVVKPFLNKVMSEKNYDVIFVSSISKDNDKKGFYILILSDKLTRLGYSADIIMKEANSSPYVSTQGLDNKIIISDAITYIVDRNNLSNVIGYITNLLSNI